MPRNTIFIAILVFHLSCKRETCNITKMDEITLVKECFIDNQIISYSEYNMDTVLDGNSIEYFSTGNYKVFKQYYNGNLLGEIITYFDINPDTVIRRSDSMLVAMPYINAYKIMNSAGMVSFESKYNSDNKLLTVFGSAVTSIYCPDTVNVDEKFFVGIEIPLPPYLQSEVLIGFDKNNPMENMKKYYTDDGYVRVDTLLKETGYYNIMVCSNLYDTKNVLIESDSVKLSFYVKSDSNSNKVQPIDTI